MAGVAKKVVLPKAVLDMKFMKKTKERIEKEIENTQDHSSLYANIITNEMRSASGNYITEQSFMFCETLIEGRLSFKGMNPEIERLMEVDAVQKEKPSGEMVKDVSDDILAKKMKAFNKRKRPLDRPKAADITGNKKSKN